MMTTTMITAAETITSLAVGVSLHVFVFRHGEWDLAASKLGAAAAAAPFAVALALRLAPGAAAPAPDLWSLGATSLALASACFAGVFASMLVYRGFLHRLRHFPGPFPARFSHFWITARSLGTHQEYVELQKLHETYGDVVRIGPSTLSINDSRALHAVHGPGSKCTKAPWYNTLYPLDALHTIRNPQEHAQRRRAWEKGFSTKALKNYEPRVSIWADKVLERIALGQGQPLDVSLWFNFYSFDVMGDLSLGESFGMLERGKSHWFMESLHGFMLSLGAFSHIMWAIHIFNRLPIVSSQKANFYRWVGEAVDKRMENPPDVPDIFSSILDAYHSKPKPTTQDKLNLLGDGILSTVAGSDTTAAALTCLFLELATHPEATRHLQQELDSLFEEESAPDQYVLSKAKYLQACVDETLRLYPAVPSGGQRCTPPEGLKIGKDLFIPGGTIVQTPPYMLHRDERNFAHANEFIAERWTTKPHLIKDASVYVPFSIGPYNCVGKQLGLMEIRSVTSRILRRYNVALAPGQTAEAFRRGLIDGFTTACPKLDLIFTPRQ